MERTWRKVSGRIASRITQVRPMIEPPHPSPTLLCQNLRIASLTSISGWRTLASTNMSVRHLAPAEEPLAFYGIEAAAAERVAAKQPPAGQQEASQHTVGAAGLHGVRGAGRKGPAARCDQGRDEPLVEPYGKG